MTSADCLRCGQGYTRPHRSRTHFCVDCRKLRKRESDAVRVRDLRDAERTARAQIETYIERGMDRAYADRYLNQLDAVVEDLRVDLTRPVVPDQMPTGSNTPRGPDEGTSTGWRDLAEILEAHAILAAAHPWFIDNPHWNYDLHAHDTTYLKAS